MFWSIEGELHLKSPHKVVYRRGKSSFNLYAPLPVFI